MAQTKGKTRMISTRIDEDLLAEVDNYAAAKDKTRSDAIQGLLRAALEGKGVVFNERSPGWDSKEIARIANDYYQGLGLMFEIHNWPERGSKMITVVQAHVVEAYGSVEDFIKAHARQTPQEFRKGLPSLAELPIRTPEAAAHREYMRELVKQHGLNQDVVCSAFVDAVKSGSVDWKNNMANDDAEFYAAHLWANGTRNGWLQD